MYLLPCRSVSSRRPRPLLQLAHIGPADDVLAVADLDPAVQDVLHVGVRPACRRDLEQPDRGNEPAVHVRNEAAGLVVTDVGDHPVQSLQQQERVLVQPGRIADDARVDVPLIVQHIPDRGQLLASVAAPVGLGRQQDADVGRQRALGQLSIGLRLGDRLGEQLEGVPKPALVGRFGGRQDLGGVELEEAGVSGRLQDAPVVPVVEHQGRLSGPDRQVQLEPEVPRRRHLLVVARGDQRLAWVWVDADEGVAASDHALEPRHIGCHGAQVDVEVDVGALREQVVEVDVDFW